MGTHKGITDPLLRKIMASELLILRRQAKRLGWKRDDDPYFWTIVGFETALRRVEVQKAGER